MLTDWLHRVRSLFKRDEVERDLDDELRFHFDGLVDVHLRRGLSREEAVRRARLQLGGLDQIKEAHRDARGIGVIQDLGRDVRHAFRQFGRAPGFAAVAVVCLGLGIGVNTAIFGVMSAVLLRPMPVAHPEELVAIARGEDAGWSYPVSRDFAERSRTLAALTVSFPMESDLDVDGDSEFVASEVVPANYASVIGITPSLGRWFADDREPVAVISHAVWQRRFSASADVLGRRISSGSQSYTVVGVAPREFTGVFAPMRTDLWVPTQTRPWIAALLEDRRRTVRGLMLLGRLKESVTAAQASTELNAIDAQLVVQHGRPEGTLSPIVAEHVRGLPDPGMRRRLGTMTTLLGAVVGLVLLIACVNVGNLLLVRGALRRRELTMRRALGASRTRLLRQLLTESLVLAVGGSLVGVVLAAWTNRLLERTVPPVIASFAIQLDLSLDWRAVVFATITAVVTTVLCGLLPAWRGSRGQVGVDFKGEVGGGMSRRRPIGLVTQVIVSLVLLFVAGSVLQALQRMQSSDAGFDVATRLYAYTFTPTGSAAVESRREFYAQALEQLRALPGIRSAAMSSSLLTPIDSDCVALPAGARVPTTSSLVDPGYFDIMGIDVVAGRQFTTVDVSNAAATVVLNESLVRRLQADARIVGQQVTIGCDSARVVPATVIGIVRNPASAALTTPGQSHVYRPFVSQASAGFAAFVFETSGDAAGAVQPIRRTLLTLGQGIRVYAVQPLSTYVEQRSAPLQWIASMLSVFGVLALLLAAVGLYGVIAYRVALRTQEIGVRMALGASRSDVFREVLSYGLVIVMVGVAIGEILTAALTRAAGSLQEGIAPTGVSTHIGVAATWIAVALCACYLPAARAARVDPMVALRHE
jgi:putative ABC transport system permease protein